MGVASRIISTILRAGQLFCGAVVLGILGHFFHNVGEAHALGPGGRLIYTATIAGITILASLVLIPPFAHTFWSFPLDFLLFAAWLLSGLHTCRSGWFRTYWGFYWGEWRRVVAPGITRRLDGCSAWRSVLAFSFIAMFLYLLSSILGLLWVRRHGKFRGRRRGEPIGVAPPPMEASPAGAASQPAPPSQAWP
ncbi:uncharacterized protein THITE_151086 [Thermothielavioides terrestris NRRL 8126]|uniref:MARVEL domain-containing protein n=1 Tax=Thermothielavioides terrestris (strain ATCC 38088 / NRRL 8126) TaxID=578455 RepID=G2R1A1_THETT|nr:uncharacterized protein THITE_151086 [Thermothielavioides terrestris NRRL 8126]AEO67391.1 hypothetical protein THITE_151086 [Thermothielavioides terrestris NRRL 8126]